MTYRFLEHIADVKFQAQGETLEECFSEAAKALAETIYGEIILLSQEQRTIETEGKDLESLLYNFLEEFLYLLDAEDFLFSKIQSITIDQENFKLKAKVYGDKASSYKFTNDVKAVTYNSMFIKNEANKWICQVVLDV